MLDAIDVGTNVFLNMGGCTCGAVVLVVPLIRQFGVADCDSLLVGSASAEDGEVEDVDNAIAGSGGIWLCGGVLTCGCERLSTPCIRQFIVTDSDALGLGDSGWQDSEY